MAESPRDYVFGSRQVYGNWIYDRITGQWYNTQEPPSNPSTAYPPDLPQESPPPASTVGMWSGGEAPFTPTPGPFSPTPTPSPTATPTPTPTPTETPQLMPIPNIETTPPDIFHPAPSYQPSLTPIPNVVTTPPQLISTWQHRPILPPTNVAPNEEMLPTTILGNPPPNEAMTATPAIGPNLAPNEEMIASPVNFVPNPAGGYYSYDQNWQWMGSVPDIPSSTAGIPANPAPGEGGTPYTNPNYFPADMTAPNEDMSATWATGDPGYFPGDQPPDLSGIPANVPPDEAGASAFDQYGAPTDTYLPPDQEPSTVATGAYPPTESEPASAVATLPPPAPTGAYDLVGPPGLPGPDLGGFGQPMGYFPWNPPVGTGAFGIAGEGGTLAGGDNIGAGPLAGAFAGLGSFDPGTLEGTPWAGASAAGLHDTFGSLLDMPNAVFTDAFLPPGWSASAPGSGQEDLGFGPGHVSQLSVR